MPRSVVVWREAPAPATRAWSFSAEAVAAFVVAGPRGRAFADAVDAPSAARVVVTAADALPVSLSLLVDLTALDAPPTVAAALADAKASLFLLQRARASLLAPTSTAAGYVCVVNTHAHDDADAIAACRTGLVKTAALEWPSLRCLALDATDPAALTRELALGLPDLEVRVRDGMRLVPVVLDEQAGRGALALGADDVIVASGGARGVTATTLLALARAAKPRVLLLGRTRIDVDEPACCRGAASEAALKGALIAEAKRSGAPLALPAIAAEAQRVLAVREIGDFVKALENAGARVRYAAVDVRDARAVAAAVDGARTAWGPITALVHGAGVLADKRIEDKTQEQVDRVMDTKVLGLLALLEACARDPLKAVCLFSSVAGRFGNVGQVDYAMANEALTHLGALIRERHPHAAVKSMMWGPWEGGMVTPALKAQFLARGVRVLSHADGARHFVDELRLDTSSGVEVVYGGELGGPTAEAAGTSRASFLIDARRFPSLVDHAIADVPVLPLVGALELFVRTCRARTIEDVRVLRGVRLPRFSEGGHTLNVHVDAAGQATLHADGATQASYSARLIPNADAPAQLVRGALDPYAFSKDAIYSELLFHGPQLQAIDDVVGASSDGLVAQVRGMRALGWTHFGVEPSVLDVAALDAALQATLLWARHVTGGAYLPTSLARLIVGSGIADGAYRCVVAGRSTPDLVAEADVTLVTAAGEVAYRLEGVRVHRLPDDAAFSRPPVLAEATA